MTSRKKQRVLPGFGLSLGFTLLYLSLIVLIPLGGLFLKSATLSWDVFWATVTDPRVLASYRLSLGTSLAAAMVNAFFGLIVAWVLVRYRFPGKRIVDALIDLPFALPTAVAGITLTALLSQNGWLGRPLEAIGLKVAFTPLGITVPLLIITKLEQYQYAEATAIATVLLLLSFALLLVINLLQWWTSRHHYAA